MIIGVVREVVLINFFDVENLGLKDGDDVVLKNDLGEFKGWVYLVLMKFGNL